MIQFHMKKYRPVSLKSVKSYSLCARRSKVSVGSFAHIPEKGDTVNNFLGKLPNVLAARDLREVAAAVVSAREKDRPVILGMGAHPIKLGLSPIIIELMKKGIITSVAVNGACAVHDFEVALVGHTSEDVAMELLRKFLQKDGIAYYDPTRLHDVGDNPEVPGARYRRAKFKTMLRGFCQTYVLSERDKQMVRHQREPWRLEKRLNDGSEDGPTWAESDFYAEDPLEIVETQVVVRVAVDRSREILIERSTATRDYKRFCDLIEWQMFVEGRKKPDRKVLQAELGISASTVNAMWKEYKRVIGPMMEGCA